MRRLIAACVASAIFGCTAPKEHTKSQVPEPTENSVILLEPIEVVVSKGPGTVAE